MTSAKRVPILFILVLIFFKISTAFAQAPNISYTSPQNYTVNVTIVPLAPANSGGAVPANAYGKVTTIAGTGMSGAADGVGTAASFNTPRGITIDGSGNLYIADDNNNLIRKITPVGIVSTLAGNGIPNSIDGTGASASFNHPAFIVCDKSGNLFETEGNLVRKISQGGVVTTIAGSINAGSSNGIGTNATFNIPLGLDIDAAGNIYIADLGNNLIRKMTPAGVVSTFAGSGAAGKADGAGTVASFYRPIGIAVDVAGNIIVGDDGYSLIRKITPAGLVSTLAGNGMLGYADGLGAEASFEAIFGLATDTDGNIYVADANNNFIRKVDPNDLVSTIAGGNYTFGFADGIGEDASFDDPCGIVSDKVGYIYITDSAFDLIRKISIYGYTIDKPLPPGLTFDPTTGIITGAPAAVSPATDYTITAYNTGGSSSAVVNITVKDNANAVIPPNITYQNPQVYYVSSAITPLAPVNTGGAVPTNIYGEVFTFAGNGSPGNANGTGAAASFDSPAGIAFDGAGNLFVSEIVNNDVRKITPAGAVSTFAGTGAPAQANPVSFNSPYQLSFDASGNMYLANEGNMIIEKIDAAGIVNTFAGNSTQGSTDGSAATASFNNPFGVAADGSGNVYVTDRGNSRMRKIDLSGQVTTIGSFDGGAPPANNAQGLGFTATDASGNIYFVDDNQVKEITTAGAVNIIAGSSTAGFANGQGTAARFNWLVGITLDALGNIYVGDSGNNLIRKITQAGEVTTLAGSGGQGNNNGVSSSASFNAPFGVAVDNTGNFLYVADNGNHLIRKVAITGYSIDKSLPVGLTFDPSTGIVSGMPVVVSPLTIYTITAYNEGGSSTFKVSIEVDEVTIAFNPIPVKTVCDADFDPGATSAAPITYTSNNAAVATIISGKVHITGAGTSTITASDGTSTSTQTLTVNAAITPTITISPAAIDTCQGSTVIYTAAITNGGTAPTYQWQVNGQDAGANGAMFTSNNLNNNDKLTCTLTSNATCTTNAVAVSNAAAFTIDVPVSESISIISTAPGPICAGTEVTFIATAVSSGNMLNYQWQINGQDAGANSPIFSSNNFADGDFVTCTLTSNGKCLINPVALSNVITINLNPVSACVIVIPNTFTPNGDGINDLWDITALQGYPNCTVTIFNRYGTVVYNATGYPKAWDGTFNGRALPNGTYYYVIDPKNGKRKLAGPVTILR